MADALDRILDARLDDQSAGDRSGDALDRIIDAKLQQESADPRAEIPSPPVMDRSSFREGMRERVTGIPQDTGGKREALKQFLMQTPDSGIGRWLAEYASSVNRSVTELVDFLGTDTINTLLRQAGVDTQIPTATGALDSVGGQGGFMEPGALRDATRVGGQLTTAALGMAPIQRQAGTAVSTLADLAGFGSSAVTAPVKTAGMYADDLWRTTKNALTPVPQSVDLALKDRAGSASTFGFQLDDAGRAVADPRQAKAAKQGFQEGFVTMVRDTTRRGRERMRQMLDLLEQSKDDFRHQGINRPQDIAGESVANRVRIIKAANEAAGSRLNDVAKRNLRGKTVDFRPAVEELKARLDEMGVAFNEGDLALDFSKSDIDKQKGPQRVLTNFMERLASQDVTDAYEIHRMKRWIDSQVAYGKGKGNITEPVVNVMKGFRRAIDSILDANFPEYNAVNTEYAETINALNNLQDIAGKRMDLTGPNADKALGTLLRRILGNAQSRVPLYESLEDMDALARRYVTPEAQNVVPYKPVAQRAAVTLDDLDDDVLAQLRFSDELDRMFGSQAPTSFQGDISKAVETAVTQGKEGVITEAVRAGANRVRGINDKNAIKALRELLKD